MSTKGDFISEVEEMLLNYILFSIIKEQDKVG